MSFDVRTILRVVVLAIALAWLFLAAAVIAGASHATAAEGDVQLEQMPLLSGLMALVGGIVPDGNWLDSSRWYLVIWTLLITVALAVAVWCVGRLRPQRLDLATQLALSPVHVVAALLSPDLVVVTLVMAAMLGVSPTNLPDLGETYADPLIVKRINPQSV
mgnify:CR=1 FL=1